MIPSLASIGGQCFLVVIWRVNIAPPQNSGSVLHNLEICNPSSLKDYQTSGEALQSLSRNVTASCAKVAKSNKLMDVQEVQS
jgi:hypothetical protein